MRSARRIAAPVVAGPFGAGKDESSDCDDLKPGQRLSEDRQKELDSTISPGLKGLGQGSGSIDKSSESSVQIQVLKDDALAKSWFIFQVCVMKKAEVIDETTAQELVRSLMGLEPTSVTITTTPPAAPSSTSTPAAEAVLRISGPDKEVDVQLDGSGPPVGLEPVGVDLVRARHGLCGLVDSDNGIRVRHFPSGGKCSGSASATGLDSMRATL